MGDGLEQEFALAIGRVVQRKSTKMAGCEPVGESWLLVYGGHTVLGMDVKIDVDLCHDNLKDCWSAAGFDAVFVDVRNRMVKFMSNAPLVVAGALL